MKQYLFIFALIITASCTTNRQELKKVILEEVERIHLPDKKDITRTSIASINGTERSIELFLQMPQYSIEMFDEIIEEIYISKSDNESKRKLIYFQAVYMNILREMQIHKMKNYLRSLEDEEEKKQFLKMWGINLDYKYPTLLKLP